MFNESILEIIVHKSFIKRQIGNNRGERLLSLQLSDKKTNFDLNPTFFNRRTAGFDNIGNHNSSFKTFFDRAGIGITANRANGSRAGIIRRA